jgi:hypothetical protein
MSARISALESTHAEFKQQISEVLQTSQTAQQSLQQNTLVLNNLSSMVCILMEKIDNQGSVIEPTTPTAQNTNSHMPSLDPVLISGAGSEGDTPRKICDKVVGPEEATDVPNLIGDGVLGEGGSAEGGSKMGDSKGGVTEGNGSPGCDGIENSSLGGVANVDAPNGGSSPIIVVVGLEGGQLCGLDAGSGSKVVERQ